MPIAAQRTRGTTRRIAVVVAIGSFGLAAPRAASSQPAPEPAEEPQATDEVASERFEAELHAGAGVALLVDRRDAQTRVAAGPTVLLEWQPLRHFAVELAAGVGLGVPDPIFVIELLPEIVFDTGETLEPFVTAGPVLSFETGGEEPGLAFGLLVGAGLDYWPGPKRRVGAYAKLVYRLLGGPTLIQQGALNAGILLRL